MNPTILGFLGQGFLIRFLQLVECGCVSELQASKRSILRKSTSNIFLGFSHDEAFRAQGLGYTALFSPIPNGWFSNSLF